ncbi:hypothetical protein NQZ68_026736 [Dissostichus eleginoides]|nr:hypothetical protein NQZ68_026736 [Dissostichus eleginoides]
MWTSNALNREADIDHCPADTNPSIEPRDRRETEVETGESMRMMEPLRSADRISRAKSACRSSLILQVQGKAALMQTHSGVFLLASLRLWERNALFLSVMFRLNLRQDTPYHPAGEGHIFSLPQPRINNRSLIDFTVPGGERFKSRASVPAVSSEE